MEDYIICEFGKIIIKIENNKNKYYKNIDDKLYELSSEELRYVESIFKRDDDYTYYSEKLDNIVSQNPNFNNYKDWLMNFLNFIEQIIPEGCHDNFYRNVKTLMLDLKFDLISEGFSNVDSSLKKDPANYNTKENKLTIDPSWLKFTWEISRKNKNPDEFFWREISCNILHELLHMASSYYDEENNTVYCGFDKNTHIESESSYVGLTEGMTEVLSFPGVPSPTEVASGYYIECLIINQLVQIVGRDTLLVPYFKSQGTKMITDELDKITNEPLESQLLMLRIENNFWIRKVNLKQSLLGNIQSSLIEYFKKKVENDLKNGVGIEVIQNQMTIFELMLITKEKLLANGKNPDSYVGIEESVNHFIQFKDYFMKLKEPVVLASANSI